MEKNISINKIFEAAVKNHQDGNFKEAETLYKKIIQIDSQYAAAYNNLGAIFLNSDKNKDALGFFNKAITINPKYIDAINNLGATYLNLKMPKRAKDCFEKVININPNYADVQYNLGNSFKDLGEYEKAIEKYSKSLEIKPTYTNALTNLTAILIQLRRIDQLELNKSFSNIYENQSEPNKLLYLVYIMIEKFIKLDIHTTELLIDKIKKLINTNVFSELSKKDNAFIFAYHTFLTRLLKIFLAENPNFKEKNNNNDDKIIYHIGESHCLSFAHKKVKIDDMLYTIKPRIIFGTKAWHLGNAELNSYKSFFKYQVNSILDGSIVFLSFGEIDCRVNEGIIQYCEKKKGSLDGIIKNTVENYLKFTENEFKNRNIKRLYFGIPAPKIYETKSEKERKINLLRINVIKKFNIYLKSSLLKKKLNFADVYKLTSTSKGISNNKYHCDDIHLIPSTIDYFKKQIANLKF